MPKKDALGAGAEEAPMIATSVDAVSNGESMDAGSVMLLRATEDSLLTKRGKGYAEDSSGASRGRASSSSSALSNPDWGTWLNTGNSGSRKSKIS